MLDARVRNAVAPVLEVVARPLVSTGVAANALTVVGFVFGVGACAAAALALWWTALALWVVNRVLDGLDGAVARLRGVSDRGGFLDIISDFSVYGGFVLGVAIAVPDARLACAALLTTYYVSGTAFLALSSIAERRVLGRSSSEAVATRALEKGDERSLRFVGGLAEGTETFVVYVLFCLLPGSAEWIAWGFSAAVAVTAVQRVVGGLRALRQPAGGAMATPVQP